MTPRLLLGLMLIALTSAWGQERENRPQQGPWNNDVLDLLGGAGWWVGACDEL